ncbi:hypothetical protein NFI96_033713, partial [Prochilodus magdalenae]
MAWKKSGESLALFSVLVVVLRPLGHCAVLRAEEKPDSVKVLNVNTPASLLVGQGGSEKPESKPRPGKLIIGAPEDYSNIPESLKSGTGSLLDSDYQSDQADWSGLQHLQGSVSGFGGSNSPAVQKLLGMRPKVDCDEETMMLKVHGGVGAFGFGLLIDRGSVPPLPLSRMPSDCGLHIQKTWWGLVFIVPYDGCYVAQERDAYILPLRLWGLPAKMSCPLLNLAPSPPSVSCYPNGMIVKTQDVAPVEDLYVKVENEWQPLLKASPKCGYSIVSHSGGVVVSAPYKPCMEAKDGVYSLLMAAKNEFRLYCPSLVPTLPLNLTRPVSPDQNGRVDTSLPMKGSRWDYLPQRPQRPAVFPTDVPPESFEAFGVLGATGSHEAPPQMRPGSVFAQGPQWYYPPQYPQRPSPFPTALPSETFEASSVLGAT